MACGLLWSQAAGAEIAKCRVHPKKKKWDFEIAVHGMTTKCAGQPGIGPTALGCPFFVPGFRSRNLTPFAHAVPILGLENGPDSGAVFVTDRARILVSVLANQEAGLG